MKLDTFELNERLSIEHDCALIGLTMYRKSMTKLNGDIVLPSPMTDNKFWAAVGRVWSYVVENSSKGHNYVPTEEEVKEFDSDDILQLLESINYFASNDSIEAKSSFLTGAGKIAGMAILATYGK